METLLVVEDDVHQAELYKQELGEEGYNIVLAHDGHEALKKLEENKFELVVLDISMPGMDGIEALGKILGRDNTMPVIIHTAYAQYKDNFMTWTAEHYIIKSSDLTELKAKIREVLDLRKK
jgi:DNA-binding response OmpR family regulator